MFDGSRKFVKPNPEDDPRDWAFFTCGKGVVVSIFHVVCFSLWRFIERVKYCLQIHGNIVGRYAQHPYMLSIPFFFLGRENRTQGKHTVIEFSYLEGRQIMSFLKEIILQIRQHPSKGRSMESIIPFFDGKDDRAFENPTDTKQLLSYFQDSDLPTVTSVKLRIRRNNFDQYELLICRPAPTEKIESYNGSWIGPRMTLSVSGMEALYSFLYQSQNGQDNISFVKWDSYSFQLLWK